MASAGSVAHTPIIGISNAEYDAIQDDDDVMA
jgi:hypothetical protein